MKRKQRVSTDKFAIKKKPKYIEKNPSESDNVCLFILKNATLTQLAKICYFGCSKILKDKKIQKLEVDFTLKKGKTEGTFILVSPDKKNGVSISKEKEIKWTPTYIGMKNETMACKFLYINIQDYIQKSKIDCSKSKLLINGVKHNIF